MTEPNFPDAPEAYTPSEDDAPSWEELRREGCMLIDDSLQQLAVYTGGGGTVVLMEQSFDSPMQFVVIDHQQVSSLVAALTKRQAEAAANWAEIEAEIDAFYGAAGEQGSPT